MVYGLLVFQYIIIPARCLNCQSQCVVSDDMAGRPRSNRPTLSSYIDLHDPNQPTSTNITLAAAIIIIITITATASRSLVMLYTCSTDNSTI